MKLLSTISLVAALSFTTAAFSQPGQPKTSENKPMQDMEKGMDMKGMDMDKCMHMKGMDMKGMEMKGMDAQQCKEMMGSMKESKTAGHAGMHVADGIVKAVDPAGKVTLQHGPVKSLKWPAMAMTFAVKDKAMLDKLAVGSKVHVEFSKQGEDYVINSVK